MVNSKKKQPQSGPPSLSRAPSTAKSPASRPQAGFPIVGIGASAGGLEAFSQLLTHLPADTGMAFVLVQHLDPRHESMSAEIFSRATRMKVAEVKEGVRMQPNCVYVIPPGYGMAVTRGTLNLLPRTEVRGQYLVINSFFQSLAEDQKNRAVGVILSGTASDGTQGLMAIKAGGGITFAQSPKTAKFDGMPQSAINAGAVDLVLNPQQIAEELSRIARHPYVVPAEGYLDDLAASDEAISPQGDLKEIFLLLRSLCHVDFTLYKTNTIRRRIERRMVLHKVQDLRAYSKFVAENLNEVKGLFADILINVTSFFRDPTAFEALKSEVFPKLMEGREPGSPIRIWSPGCSTGEEVYSIAISLLEFLGEEASSTPVQIFASDISEQAIQKARLGEYPESIGRDVSKERLSRFFMKTEEGRYKIAKAIRDICLFSRHDLTADPPFPKMDLVACRNLLIYFTVPLQRHVFPIFHYALRPMGFLWLGQSESIGEFSDLFELVDKTNKIYSKKHAPMSLSLSFPPKTYVPEQPGVARRTAPRAKVAIDIQALADHAIQEEYPGVLVNEDMEILQFRGRVGPFVNPAPGVPSNHLFKMMHPEIVPFLRVAIQATRKTKASVKKDGLSLKGGHAITRFSLKVLPVKAPSLSKERYYLIHFENVVESRSGGKKTKSKRRGNAPDLVELQQELASSQEYQQSLIERYETAQENLTASNEELQSANEELQSTNEELETAKEELQSGNEELTTVNDELQSRSVEQSQTNNDLVNLLGSVQIPIVMLGNDRRVRRFTPLAGKALNLITTDVGRPISDLKFNFTSPGIELDLERMTSDVIETMQSQEIEIQDRQGRWFRLQVRPYRTIDGRIDGAVLALVDIDGLKQSLKEVKAARTEAEKANRAKDLFLATLSHELRTPLTAILSWAQMLQSGRLDADKVKRAGQMIADCGKTQAALINDLLDVSRIIMGKIALEMIELNPVDIVLRAIESVRPASAEKSIEIETSFDPWAGTVMADPVRLQQVFLNLLTNAIKFSSQGSKVVVRLEKVKDSSGEKAKALIKVIDSGKGIGSEFIPHIFDSFSQEDNSSIRVHGGLGLGLAIVKNLVELHGGEVKAESPGEKLGATFTVILPVKSEYQSIDSSLARTVVQDGLLDRPEARIRLDGLRVLIVDDQASAREAFAETLRSFGAETRDAPSAREGRKVFGHFRPHVLVSDIAMPDEDGYSFIRKIRALSPDKGGNTLAIALTAYASAGDVKRAIASGFNEHLSKPVDMRQLAEFIARLAARKKS